MIPTIAAARAGATTGEWARTLREVFGSYRAPTGVGEASGHETPDAELTELREEVSRLQERLGRRPKILVGKPGLDGHSNGAEQIAVRARDAGMDVVYEGIRLTPAQIAASALQEGVHVIGLSILSGSHRELIPAVIDALREAGVTAPVVVGGIIPDQDVAPLKRAGVACVYTPKDFDLTQIMRDIVELVGSGNGTASGNGAGVPNGNGSAWATPPPPTAAAPAARPTWRERRRRGARRAPARARPERGAGGAEPAGERHRPQAREQSAALLREVSPRALGGEAPGHVIGITGPPGAGKSTLLSALLHAWRAWRPPPGRSRCWPSTRARAAPAARCSATARGSSSTPPTAAS